MKRHFLAALGVLLLTPSGFAIVDTNDNGLSDVWERHYNSGNLFAESFDPKADPDTDGWTNAQEAAAGTNPSDPNPPFGLILPKIVHTPAILGAPDENGTPVVISPEAVTVTWPTLVGKQYTLLFSPDMTEGSWIPIGVPYIGDGNDSVYGFEIQDSDKCFWRVQAEDVDTDGDGLTDAEEYLINVDDDHDGVPDEWERLISSILFADYGIIAPVEPTQFDVNVDYGGINTSARLVYQGLAGDFDLATTEVVASPFVEGSMKSIDHYKGGFVDFTQLPRPPLWQENGPVVNFFKTMNSNMNYDYGEERIYSIPYFFWDEEHGYRTDTESYAWTPTQGWTSSVVPGSQYTSFERWTWVRDHQPYPYPNQTWSILYYNPLLLQTCDSQVSGDPPYLVDWNQRGVDGQWTSTTATKRVGQGAEHSEGVPATKPNPGVGYVPTSKSSETFTLTQELSDPYTTGNLITDAQTALTAAPSFSRPPVSLQNLVENESKISLKGGQYRLGWTLPSTVPIYPGNTQVKAIFVWQEVTDPETPPAPGAGSGRMIAWKHERVNATPGTLAQTPWHDLPPPQKDGTSWIRTVSPHGSITLPGAILVNNDDDDGNGQADRQQASFALGTENDLIALNFEAGAPGTDEKAMIYRLEATGAGKVRLWQAFPNQQPQLVGLPYKLQTRDYSGSVEPRPTYYIEATKPGSMSLKLHAEVLGQKLALVATTEFESLEISIDFAANMKGIIGDIVPSNLANSKAVHFVTTKSTTSTEAVILTANGISGNEIIPQHANQLAEWVGAVPTAGTPLVGRVPRSSTGKYPVAIRLIGTGQMTTATNVWVTWAERQLLDAPSITTKRDLNGLEYQIKGKVAFTFDFEPAGMFDLSADVPDLSVSWDPQSPEVANQFHPWKTTEPLSDGALCKYDVSRKVRVKFETSNLQVLASEMSASVLSFPGGLTGNDDSDWRAQVPPYDKAFVVGSSYAQGEHAHSRDSDSPQFVLPHAKGANGDTFKMHADFIEFVRIQIGTKSYMASTTCESQLTFAFKKDNEKWTDDSSTFDPGLSTHF